MSYKVLTCTWNVGNAPPCTQELAALLAPYTASSNSSSSSSSSTPADLLVLGLQESTWSAIDCVELLEAAVLEAAGPDFKLVRKHAYTGVEVDFSP